MTDVGICISTKEYERKIVIPVQISEFTGCIEVHLQFINLSLVSPL